ncbi:MAG: hypothetical protein KIS81_08785 [Maricaulaceae bacterium]|nr:hypothetical protein [Maricaulaceae bacterium]
MFGRSKPANPPAPGAPSAAPPLWTALNRTRSEKAFSLFETRREPEQKPRRV